MAEESSDGSPLNVAFKVWIQLRIGYGAMAAKTVEEELELFLKCRRAVLKGEIKGD